MTGLQSAAQNAADILTGSGSAGMAAGGGLTSTGRAAGGASKNMSDFAQSAALAASAMNDAGDATSDVSGKWAKAEEEASALGSTFGDLVATSVGVSAGLESTADDADVAEGGVSDLSQAVDRASEALGAMGIAASATGLVAFFQQSVMAASDLDESMNAIDTIFKEANGTIYTFSENAGRQLGMTELAAREAAATFGIYGQQANLATDENAKFSTQMATLAGDMASFRNTSPEQAIEAIGAAFRGESDPIEAYGVILNESILKTRAMKDGLIETTAEALEPAVRVQVAYSEILAQTSYMQGDFEKTSGSLSNRLKTLRADFEAQSVAVGNKLMPAAQALVSLLSGPGMVALSGTSTVVGALADGVGALATFMANLPGPIQMAIGAIVALRIASAVAGTALGQSLVARATQARTAITNMGSSTAGVVSAMRTQFGYLQQASRNATGGVQTLGGTMRNVGTMGMSAFRAGAGSLVGFLGGPWGIAFAAAAAGVAYLISENAKAKRSAEQVAAAVVDTATQLEMSGGRFTAQGQQAAAAALESIKLSDSSTTLAESLEEVGVSSDVAAAGLAGNLSALQETRAELEKGAGKEGDFWGGFFDTDFSWDAIKSRWSDPTSGYEKDNQAAETLKKYDEAEAAIRAKQESLARVARAGGDVVFNNEGVAELGAMAEAMDEFSKSTDGAAAKVDALAQALSGLRNDKLALPEAEQAVNDSLRDLDGLKNTLGSVGVDDRGNIDTKTEAGSRAQDAVSSYADSYNQLAAAMYTVTNSSDAVKAAMQPQYDQFLRTAEAMGLTREQAEAVALQMGLLPENVALQLDTSSVMAAQDLLDTLGDTISGMPNSHTIEVESLTDDARANLEKMGFLITELPDGKGFTLEANTIAAQQALDAARGTVDGLPPVKAITVDAPGAQAVVDKLREVGVETTVNNDKQIVITDNSPETIQKLVAVGAHVTQLPDGTFAISDNTDVVRARVDSLQDHNTSSRHVVTVEERRSRMQFGMSDEAYADLQRQVAENANGAIIRAYADGGLSPMSGRNATVVPPNTWRVVGDRAQDDEFFIPDTDEAQHVALGREWARRRGLLLVDPRNARMFADGGIATAESLSSGVAGLEGAKYVWGGWDGTWNTDCSGAQSRVANIAAYGDPDAAGRFATSSQGSELAKRGFQAGWRDGALNIGWVNGGPGGGHTASTTPEGVNLEMGGEEGNGQVGGNAAGAKDFPNIMSLMLTPSVGKGSGYTAQNDPDGSKALAAGEFTDRYREAYGTEEDQATLGRRAGSGNVQDVYVTNWPGEGGEQRDPKARLTASFFADGGTVGGIGNKDSELIMAMPGEEITKKSMAQKYRGLLKAINADNVKAFADGGTVGWGGYSGPDTTDSMKPRNLYEAASLGIGMGFAALSGVSGLIGMAQSGQWDLSQLTPKFDTGANSIPALEGAFQQFSQQLEEIRDTLQKGGMIDAKIDVDTNTGRADLALTTAGVA
ncbi:phage tail protein [Rhodococcoides fascians]|uniref:phage tail protein n=1 Tax=Rhodococcoides fascians TaxID=1828 RepID=UPI0005603E34|nr:hypothetical protein [Rhodococcus fascians]